MTSSKNSLSPLSLFLALILVIPCLNLGENKPIIPILGFHGVMKAKIRPPQSRQLDIDYPQQDLEELLGYNKDFLIFNLMEIIIEI